MNKLLFAVVFSVLLLIPIGAQQVFATHLTVGCPPPGILNTDPTLTFQGTSNFCIVPILSPICPPGYSQGILFNGNPISICGSSLVSTPTPAGSCQNGAVLDANDHCVPDLNQICSTGTIVEPTQMLTCIAQAAGSMIGGALLDINTVSLLVGAIGVNPVITGLVAITMGGVAGQAVWFVHRRRKSKNS